LEEHRRSGWHQFRVDQQGQRREEQPDTLDPVCSGLATEEGIDHGHFDRLAADGINGLWPTGP
jgi:hypothetical protein